MLYQFPSTTKELFDHLDNEIRKLPESARNIFIIDLAKFCIDWQFMYLATQQVEDD